MANDKDKTQETSEVTDGEETSTPEEVSEETLNEESAPEAEEPAVDEEEASDDGEAAEEEEAEEASDDGESETDEKEEAEEASDDGESEPDEEAEETEEASDDGEAEGSEIVAAGDDGDDIVPPIVDGKPAPEGLKGIAAYFDLPDDLMIAAAHTRDSEYDNFEAYSPFPIHGMDDAMGLGRSWIPWVTFGAGTAGLLTAIALQFGTMTFDWPMIIGGKPYAPWPSFVPVMFELTVLFAGLTTALVMLIAAGCFRKPFIIDEEITKDRFVLWISAEDEAFDAEAVREFLESLDPVEIRTITQGA